MTEHRTLGPRRRSAASSYARYGLGGSCPLEPRASDIPLDRLPEAEPDRIFVLAHRWALDTAEDLTLIAQEDGEVAAQVRCRFATPASLVAMKLQSAPKRRAARAHKAGGDYLDLFRLASHPT